MEQIANKQAQPKLPTMMSILLICSFINACLKIISSLIMFIGTPVLATMLENGQLEEIMQPFFASMSEENIRTMMDSVRTTISIKPIYHIITGLLFIGSLIGVVKMLKINKTGLHIYSIAQLCMILASSIYVYKHLPTSPFWSDLMVTVLFIVIYHIGFKQIEMSRHEQEEV